MAAPIKAVGPKSDKIWRHAIMRAVNRLANDGKTKHLDILALRLIKSAAEGDVAALREVGDRLDGKPAQEGTLDVTASSSTGLERLSDNISWLRSLSERGGMGSQVQVLEPERSLLSAPLHASEEGRGEPMASGPLPGSPGKPKRPPRPMGT